MKNQITRVLAGLVLLAGGFAANANDKGREITLKTENSKSVILQMNDVKVGSEITLWNSAGELLYKDNVSSKSYSRVFNLNQLEKGELTLEVESAESLEVLPITVTDQAAEFVSTEEQFFAKPVVKLGDDIMRVFIQEGHKEYQMNIKDQFGKSVFENEIAESKHGALRYDVSKLGKGKYEIQFTADGRSFYHTIMIK